MASKTFLENLEDLSSKTGDSPGFLFRIRCPSCKKSWETDLVPFSQGKQGLVGKLFSSKTPGDPTAEAWAKEHQTAMEDVGDSYESSFIYCKKCEKYVCQKCWNSIRELCLACCAGIARVTFDDALQKAQAKPEGTPCHACGFVFQGAKFCPKCGAKIVPKGTCSKCATKIPEGAGFCPECGTKVV